MGKDYYKTLGVSKDASKETIKKEYRKLALKYHPDQNKGDKKFEEKFKEVGEAYAILSDEDKRKKYDTHGSDGFSQSDFSGFNVNDIFNSMFNSQFHQSFNGRSRTTTIHFGNNANIGLVGRNVNAKTYVKYTDAVLGRKLNVKMSDGEELKITLPKGVNSGAKLRLVGKGGKGVNGGKNGDLYIQVMINTPKKLNKKQTKLIEQLRKEGL